MGPRIFFLLGVLASAKGGQFSQRLDTPVAAYGWVPLVPVSTRPVSQNGQVYATTPYQENSPQVYQQVNGANGDAPRQLSASSPQSRTVTASITWPPEQPGQLPQGEVVGPGQPGEDIAVPETDPPVLDNSRPEDRVVETTLKTPQSHGYVVALVKKPNHLKSYFKSKVPGAVRDDQPAFFVYVPPNQRAPTSSAPQLRANNRGTSQASGVPRFLRQPFSVTTLRSPTVLVYVPPELSAPLVVPANPFLNALLEQSKPKTFLDSPLNAPWFSQSLEAPPEEIIKLTLSQAGKWA
ncbi:hypothetical protein HPB52_021807 [Rhipicephalus sanguineus]|uniref:Uncharacterized protein n=1 Tax=Rhipicephalus sanguineus TaxID=34632 RepID=A0A9D4QCF8_RHISA|nr:hypothetical protein HPB52_021807 [Rhipicephalus sanguineus]